MARQTLSQRIQLTGGDDIRRELEALGKEGEIAFQKLKAAADGASGVGSKLSENIAALRQRFGEIGKAASDFKSAVVDVSNAAATVVKNIAAVGAVSLAAATSIFLLAKSASQAADDIGKAASQTGLSTTAFQRLKFAAEQNKVPVEQFISTMDRFNRNIVEATSGNKNLAASFASIGVRLTDVSGRLRPTADVLADVSNVFARLPDGARKTALAIDLFGRSGAQLIPFLNNGAAGLAALGVQAEKLGVVLTKTQIDIGGKLNDALGRLMGAVTGLKTQLGLLFAPAITEGADRLTKLLADQRKAILAFTQDLINRAVPIIKDLIAAVTGQDAAVRNIWILEWRNAIIDFGKNVATVITGVVIPIFKTLQATAEGVANVINAIFGTNFDGQTVLIAAAIFKLTGVFTLLRTSILAVQAAAVLLATTFGLPVWATIAGIAVVAGGAYLIFANNAGEASEANKKLAESLQQLHEAQARINQSVPETVAAYKTIAEQLLANSRAAVESARIQLEQQKKITDALNEQTGDDPLGGFKGTGPEVIEARRKLADLQQALDEAMARLKIVQDDVAKAGIIAIKEVAGSVDAVGKAADATAVKTTGLTTSITVIRGGVAGITTEIVNLTDGVNKNFDAIKAGAVQVDETIRATLTPIAGFGQQVQQAGDGILRIFDDTGRVLLEASDKASQLSGNIDQVGVAASGVASDIADLGQAIDTQPLIDNANATVAALQQAQTAATAAMTAITSAATQASAGWSAVTAGIQTTVGAAQAAAAAIVAAFGSIAGQVVGAISPLTGALQSAFAAVAASIQSAISGLVSSVQGQINGLIGTLSQLQSAIASAQAAASRAGSSARGLAGGGSVRGPGSATSDSILSWLSNGEFVIRAAAVRKYGQRFFAMLNSLRLPSGGFSLGGLAASVGPAVRNVRPSFALGGSVSTAGASAGDLRPVLINIAGETFPMAATPNVVEDISRFAARKRFRASGKKPSWSGA